MSEIFDFVYLTLKWLSNLTGFTYREVNIIVYYLFLPASLVYVIGRVFKLKYLFFIYIIVNLIILMFIPDFEVFSYQLFEKSVQFLKWFEIIGLNYVQASVVICVIIPIALFGVLMYFKKNRKIA